MNFWEFATNSPFLTFFLALLLCEAVCQIAKSFGRRRTCKRDGSDK
jgi:hypothetical protein